MPLPPPLTICQAMVYPPTALLDKLSALLGPKGFTTDAATMAPWLTDWRGRFHGKALALLSPSTVGQTSRIVELCSAARVPIVPQGGNSSMVGGATPDASGQAVILSLRRLDSIRAIDPAGLAICEAGVILAYLHEAALSSAGASRLNLGARGSATIGGLAATNAGATQVARFRDDAAAHHGIEGGAA